jgi:FtsP/CotA-like multicopper oxidase with cupredoxin domain
MASMRQGGKIRLAVAVVATLAVVAPLAWMWSNSLLPDAYNMMDLGYVDNGGGPAHGEHSGHGRSVTSLTADPSRPADVTVTLTARKQRFALPSGKTIDGYTFNGSSPGPVIRASVGQLIQVRLVNDSVPDGIAVHWHGVDVPGAEDGVAGITQDAVPVGGEHIYRFFADQPGTFWYHSHQVSHEQVQKGLFGAIVITAATAPSDVSEVLAMTHLYRGVRTVNGDDREIRADAAPGRRVRVRVINTDNGLGAVWVAGAPFRVIAVDGTDLHEPGLLTDTAVLVPAGARADIEVTMPADGAPVRVHLGGPTGIVLGHGDPARAGQPAANLDMLTYGTPQPLPFNPEAASRRFGYDIGRRPGFLDGRPGLFWTVNGHLFPDVPMFTVAEGDIVRMTVANHSGETHPMHLHGHHAVVLSRNGVRATGSPWWVDSLEVGNGDSYEIAFVADNPGIWMDHCHNLPHARDGLVAHLAYEGVTTPFRIGGAAANDPV